MIKQSLAFGYKKAEQLFSEHINKQSNFNPNVVLYLGVSNLELNNYDKALLNFEKLIQSNSIDKSKGYWYKTLTYLKMDDRNLAIKELKIIVENPSNYNYNKAKELLEKLK